MPAVLKGIAKIWKQWRCEHFWRPGISGRLQDNPHPSSYKIFYKTPVQVCDYCGKEVELSPEEFLCQIQKDCVLMPAVKAHIKDSEDPIQEGSTVIANCGEVIPNMKYVFVIDMEDTHEKEVPEDFSPTRNLCRKCQIPAWKTRMRYGIANGQELKHGEG